MRWMRDIAVVVGLATVGLGFTGAREEQRSQDALIDAAARQTRELERMIKYRAATKTGDLNSRGWPVTMDPAWFEQTPPLNPMLDCGEHPWVEVAPLDESTLLHPPIRIAIDESVAQFWYNPYQGIVRARVPVMVNDDLAVQTYNQVNGTALRAIFDYEKTLEAMEAESAARAAAAATQKKESAARPSRRGLRREGSMVRVNKPVVIEVPRGEAQPTLPESPLPSAEPAPR